MEKLLVFHDISMILQEGMLCYPKDVPYHRYLQRDMNAGDSSNVSVIEMSAHTGTHLAAAGHYFPDGMGIHRIPLEHVYGPAYVLDARGHSAVTAEILKNALPPHVQRLLLKTDNSNVFPDRPGVSFNRNFVYVDADAAQFLVDRRLLLVGIDYLSIDKSGEPSKPAHHILLEKDITILEGIHLASVEQGWYFLACGPLKLKDSDGAPCRAVLIENLPGCCPRE